MTRSCGANREALESGLRASRPAVQSSPLLRIRALTLRSSTSSVQALWMGFSCADARKRTRTFGFFHQREANRDGGSLLPRSVPAEALSRAELLAACWTPRWPPTHESLAAPHTLLSTSRIRLDSLSTLRYEFNRPLGDEIHSSEGRRAFY